MAEITLRGDPIQTNGDLPPVGSSAPDFTLTKADWSPLSKDDLAGQHVVLNIFPSLDTGTCQQTVRAFNERAAALENTTVVCVSADLPPAAARFCGAEGIENVVTGSTFLAKDLGMGAASATLDTLGYARKVTISSNTTWRRCPQLFTDPAGAVGMVLCGRPEASTTKRMLASS